MTVKLIAGPVLASLFLATSAFSAVIDKATWNTTLPISEEGIQCSEIGGSLTSYVNMGEPRIRISVALDSGELSWLPILPQLKASLTKDQAVCPSLKDLVGEVDADGRTPVVITRTLETIKRVTYSPCDSKRLDERIEIKLSNGTVLTSRATRALGGDCIQN